MDKKGFTSIELLIAATVVFILVAMIFVTCDSDAADTQFLAMPATGQNIIGAAYLMKKDSALNVLVIAYRATWDASKTSEIDDAIDATKKVIQEIADVGIDNSRIVLGMANKDSMFTDDNPHVKEDGIYLLLAY